MKKKIINGLLQILGIMIVGGIIGYAVGKIVGDTLSRVDKPNIILFLITFQINDFEDAISLTVTSISNAGPAFNHYGPMSNFSEIPYFTKIVLSISMLLGRLELMPLIVFFSANTWKKRRKKARENHRIINNYNE